MKIKTPSPEEIQKAKVDAENIGSKEIDGIECMTCLNIYRSGFDTYCGAHKEKPDKVPCSEFHSSLKPKFGNIMTEGNKWQI